MYLLNISYSQPPAAVQPHIASHGAWVKQHIEDGSFLFAGPKRSGLGGVILASAMPKPALLALLAADSYVLADVADYQIAEFDCKIAAPQLQSMQAPA